MNYTQMIVTIGGSALGILSGVVGTYSVLKKEALLSDAIGHSSIFGISLMYILFRSKNTYILLLGALITGIIFLLNIHKKKAKDSSMAILLSFYFGLGLVLLSYISNNNMGNYSGLTKYIFGQVTSMLKIDVYVLLIVSILILFIITIFFKEFNLVTFDKDYAKTLGFKPKFFSNLISVFLVITTIIGIQISGAILISSLIILPSTSAKMLTKNFTKVVILSGFFGGLSALIGTYISSSISNLPTGPMISLSLSLICMISYIVNHLKEKKWATYYH